MIGIVVGVVGSSLVAAIILMKFSVMTVVVVTPLLASVIGLLAGYYIAQERSVGVSDALTHDWQAEASNVNLADIANSDERPSLGRKAA